MKEQGFRAEQQLAQYKEARSSPIKDESRTLAKASEPEVRANLWLAGRPKVAHLRKGVSP